MKNYKLIFALVVCCAFGLMPGASYAQGRNLTDAQLQAITNPKLETCASQSNAIDPASVIPSKNAREHTPDRVARTLNGVWEGLVWGDPNDVKIHYFWIIDTKNNEAVIIALRNGNQSAHGPSLGPNAPKITFLMCPNDGYIPSKDVPMINQFVKISKSIGSAHEILTKATGVKIKGGTSLSDMWDELVKSGYFSGLPATAFAGGFFKPIQIASVANAVGPAGVSVQWGAEYRGGGSTSIKYQPGVPLVGIEHGEFIGTSNSTGDYLVSSPGNGKIWKVEASMSTTTALNKGGKAGRSRLSTYKPPYQDIVDYDLAFAAVTVGPLEP
jgi:hypothetical protein